MLNKIVKSIFNVLGSKEPSLQEQRNKALHREFDIDVMQELFADNQEELSQEQLNEFFVKSSIAHNADAIDFFKDKGADINAMYNGNTALTACARRCAQEEGEYRYIPIIEYLLQQSELDKDVKAEDGLTAEQHAIKRRNNEIALLINPNIPKETLKNKPSSIGFSGDCVM